jgi:hypothetical protein
MNSGEHTGVLNEKTVSTSVEDDNKDTREQDETETSILDEPARWNSSRTNVFRYLAALFSFIIMGMSDAASGVSFDASLHKEYLTDRRIGIDSICEIQIKDSSVYSN